MSDIPATSDSSHLHHPRVLNEAQLVFNFNAGTPEMDYYSQLSALNQLLPSFSASLPTVQQCSFPSRQLIALANLQLQQQQHGGEQRGADASTNFFGSFRDDQSGQQAELDPDSLTPIGLLSPVSPVADRFNPELLGPDNISPVAMATDVDFDQRFSLPFARKTVERQATTRLTADPKLPKSLYQDLNYRNSCQSSPEDDNTASIPPANQVEKFNFDQLLHKTIKWSQNQSQLQPQPKSNSTLLMLSQPQPEKNSDVDIYICNVDADLSDDQQVTLITSKGQVVSTRVRRILAGHKSDPVKSAPVESKANLPFLSKNNGESVDHQQHPWRQHHSASPPGIFRFPDSTAVGRGGIQRRKSEELQSSADFFHVDHFKPEVMCREELDSQESFTSDPNDRPQSPDSSSPTIRALTMSGAFMSGHRGRISNAAASRLYAGGQSIFDPEFVGSVDGLNLEEIKEFAKQFKMKRLSLGLTQTQVGQALSLTDGPAYSQSAICRFEKLDITPKSAQKIKPVLERWMKEVDDKFRQGNTSPTQRNPSSPNSPTSNDSLSKKRKRRTSFTPQALDLLNEYFERNTHPTGAEMTALAENLNYDREVVRVWFCNKRQALKNTIKKLKQTE